MARGNKHQYVAVLPDGTEFFGEAEDGSSLLSGSPENVCEQAVRKAGLTTPRANPQKVKVGLFRLEIKEGKLERRPCGTKEVMPYLERMTEDEYATEMMDILGPLPEAFRQFVRSQAYDRGHSAGYEEVISIASDLASELLPCCKEYATQLHHDR